MSAPAESPRSSNDVLAANRTHRPDALKSFQIYTDGWDVTNIHYMASAGYTGLPGFVISLLWITTGFLFVVVVACMYLCCKDNLKPKPDFDRFGTYSTLFLLILFTVLTIAGCGALFTGLEGLHSAVSTALTYLVDQLTNAITFEVDSVSPAAAPQAAQAAAAMETATNSTSTHLHANLDSIRVWLIIVSATMLVFALIGLAFVACQMKPVIYTLVTIGWLLVVGTWILLGVSLLVSAVIGDTCVAMKEWAANPRSGTSFDAFMKCSSSHGSSSHFSAHELPPTRDEDDQYTEYYSFLNDVDQENYQSDEPNGDGGDHHQSFSLRVKKRRSVGQQKASATSPSSTSTDTCALMQQAFVPIFNAIVANNCPSMSRNAKWVWVAFVAVSTGSAVSICLWIVFTRRCTMRLAEVGGHGDTPALQFQEVGQKEEAVYNSTRASTSSKENARGSKPKTVNVNIHT